MSPSMEARITEYADVPTPPSPPPSPLSPWSSPLPHIPSPPLPPPPSSLHLPPLIPTSLPSPSSPLPPLLASLFIPSPVDCREDIPEAELPPCKKLCPTAPTSRDAELVVRAEEVGYGIRDVCVDSIEAVEEVAPTTLEGVNARVTELDAVQEQDTQDIYAVIEDTHDRQTQFHHLLGSVVTGIWTDSAHFRLEIRHHVDNPSMGANNIPPRRTFTTTARAAAAAARAAVVAAAAAPMTDAAIEQLIEARVSATLANHETLRNSTNGHGDGNHNSDTGIRGTVRTPRECTYKDFLNCKPLTFKGTKGVVVLSQWFQKMESVFHISNCAVENQGHQQQNKRQNTGRAYTTGPGEKREYTGSLPLCTKCNYHHKGPRAPRCNKCKKIGHLAHDCRSSSPNGNNNNRRNSGTTQNAGTCYECGVQGYFNRDCPKLKNKNHGNQGGNGNASAKVYVVGNAGTNPDSNVVTGTFLLNDHYASILFDTGADRSFVSTTFSSLIDITPTTLDHYYDVELADGKIIGINTIIRGCTLNFLDHPFNINLMPVELGSFDVIIGMDWLSNYA
ncbi:reverse transcriptase domain-containing protein [Tanacetum coccineum]